MSTPRPQTAEDKLVEMFEKMIDDFCETHSQDEIEAMFSKCDGIFDGIEKRHRAEGVAAPLEPSRQEFSLQLHKEWLEQKEILDFRNWLIEKLRVVAAVSKNLQEELAQLKEDLRCETFNCECYEMKIERLESEIAALRETK